MGWKTPLGLLSPPRRPAALGAGHRAVAQRRWGNTGSTFLPLSWGDAGEGTRVHETSVQAHIRSVRESPLATIPVPFGQSSSGRGRAGGAGCQAISLPAEMRAHGARCARGAGENGRSASRGPSALLTAFNLGDEERTALNFSFREKHWELRHLTTASR